MAKRKLTCLSAIAIITIVIFFRQASSIDSESSDESFNAPEGDTVVNPSVMPIVVWHGLGDCCLERNCDVTGFKRILESLLEGVYIKLICMKKNPLSERWASVKMNVNSQVAKACQQIQADSTLQDGYNAFGISQGGQFLRAVAQRCPSPRMINLITIGSQHQGVYGNPICNYRNNWVCKFTSFILRNAYSSIVQSSLVQAQYWHDPMNEELYQEKSIFLADINNDRKINEEYKTNLLKLENFVMVMYEGDKHVKPKETSWFGFYKTGQDKEVESLQDSLLYKEDRLGLQTMDKLQKLHFIIWNGEHLNVKYNQMKRLVQKFLK